MSSPDRILEAVSSSDDSSIVMGCLTPTTEQSDGQSTSNLVPLVESTIPPNEESIISPGEDLTPIERSATIEVEENGDVEADLASQPQETIYDAEGDIVFIVGPSQSHKFQLSSKLLASTSTVWEDLIASAKEAGSGTIHLPDDDPISITLLLQIVHLRFSALPRSITFQELYSLTRLSQKYHVRELFQPFVWRWAEPFIREELDPEETEWIPISQEFRIDYMFERWMEHLARGAEKDENGCIVYRDHKLAELLPDVRRDELTRIVEDARLSLLADLINVCKRGLEESCCSYRGSSPYEEQCNMLMTGYLLTGLKSLGGWPLDPSTIRTSAEEFRANLMGLHFKTLPEKLLGDGSFDLEEHYNCGFHTLVHEIAAVRLLNPINTALVLCDDQSLIEAASISPILCRLGFRRRDFDITDSDSEADDSYDDPTDIDSELDSEFEEDNSEEEGSDDGEDNKSGEEGIVGS